METSILEGIERRSDSRLEELCAQVSAGAPDTDEDHRELAASLSRFLPIAHRAGRPLLERFGGQQDPMDPLVLLPGSIDSDRAKLGTDGNVFFWLGTSAYTQPPIILIIDPAIETSNSNAFVASPWDSGGLPSGASLGYRLTPAEAAALIRNYSLPAPEYRSYLATVLTYAFAKPWDYVSGRRPRSYPGWIGPTPTAGEVTPSANLPSQTFEVRCLGPCRLAGQVLALIVDEAYFEGSRRAIYVALSEWAQRQGIRRIPVGPGSDPVRETRQFLLNHLRELGLSP